MYSELAEVVLHMGKWCLKVANIVLAVEGSTCFDMGWPNTV